MTAPAPPPTRAGLPVTSTPSPPWPSRTTQPGSTAGGGPMTSCPEPSTKLSTKPQTKTSTNPLTNPLTKPLTKPPTKPAPAGLPGRGFRRWASPRSSVARWRGARHSSSDRPTRSATSTSCRRRGPRTRSVRRREPWTRRDRRHGVHRPRHRPRPTYGRRTIAYLGDLTFLHDTNGLVIGPDEPRPDITFVVANDDGGAIFARSSRARDLCRAFERVFGSRTGWISPTCVQPPDAYERVTRPERLEEALRSEPSGIRVIEVPASASEPARRRCSTARAGPRRVPLSGPAQWPRGSGTGQPDEAPGT